MKPTILFAVSTVAACVLLTACSDIELDTVLSRLDSAETVGARGFSLDVGAKSTATIGLDEYVDSVPGIEKHPEISSSYTPYTDLTFGLGNRVDLEAGVTLGYGTLNPTLRGKVQLVGDPASQVKAGSFSMSATLGVGYVSIKENDGYSYSTGDDYIADLSAIRSDAALIFGLYPQDRMKMYGGPFYSRYDYDYTWRRYSGSTVVDRYKQSGSAEVVGANFAFWRGLGKRWHWQIELVTARVAAEQEARTLSQLGFSFGRNW